MTILSDKLLASQRDNPKAHTLDLAELYRELGRFEEAQLQLNKIPARRIITARSNGTNRPKRR